MEQNARIEEKHGWEDVRDIELKVDNMTPELNESLAAAFEWMRDGPDRRVCGWIDYKDGVMTITLGDAIPWINPGHEREKS